ncbi:MAG: hypothetical protein WDN66_04250 [Candidatus Saccharibacteria bacterium]
MGLQSQAVAPLVTEGDKLYAEKIGLLRSVNSAADLLRDGDNLSSQVVKARLGSMALGVSIYLSAEDRKRFGKSGTVTASRLNEIWSLQRAQRCACSGVHPTHSD